MKLTDIVALSGMPGLYKLVASRDNGVIVEDFDSGARTFASIRKYQFTPLETVGIYTYKDVIDLADVFEKMDKSKTKVPASNAQAAELYDYFRKIVKDFDEDQVFLGDIKKVIKWYGFLKERKLFEQSDEEE